MPFDCVTLNSPSKKTAVCGGGARLRDRRERHAPLAGVHARPDRDADRAVELHVALGAGDLHLHRPARGADDDRPVHHRSRGRRRRRASASGVGVGVVGAATVNVTVAGVPSAWPCGSTARTASVWDPGAAPGSKRRRARRERRTVERALERRPGIGRAERERRRGAGDGRVRGGVELVRAGVAAARPGDAARRADRACGRRSRRSRRRGSSPGWPAPAAARRRASSRAAGSSCAGSRLGRTGSGPRRCRPGRSTAPPDRQLAGTATVADRVFERRRVAGDDEPWMWPRTGRLDAADPALAGGRCCTRSSRRAS